MRICWIGPSESSLLSRSLEALAYIQSATILHHDVRSDNVIITSHEQAKLANFGLSRFVRDSTKNVSRLREQVRYMAPEKLENEKHRYDFKCEVYRQVAYSICDALIYLTDCADL